MKYEVTNIFQRSCRGCTKLETENHLKNGTIVFEDFEENFDKYMESGNLDMQKIQKIILKW